jgi:hypothetical protein
MIAESLNFVLDWIDEVEGEPVGTMAWFAVAADDLAMWPVWGDATSRLEVYVDDLLSYLTEFWQPLILRQHYPLPVALDRPSRLRPEIEQGWGALPEEHINTQEEAVAAFEEAHNLATSFGGQFNLPDLWLFRQGERLLVETADRLIRVEINVAIADLSALGDTIAERLASADYPKWARLVRRWHERDGGDPDQMLAWASGLSRLGARRLVQAGLLQPVSSVADAANDDDELRIAARMTGALPVAEIERLLTRASLIPARSAPALERLSRDAMDILNGEAADQKPFEQGVRIARMVRDHLRIGTLKRVDPLPMLFYANDIYVRFEELGLANLDAIAIWGRRHGPGVLVNKSSRRLRLTSGREVAGQGAARVTIAHELCHLLVDREQALGAVDILNGRMPLLVEQRARAFAAELMLPSEAAAQMWRESNFDPGKDGVLSVLKRLTQRFGVTTSIAAWQLEHGLHDEIPNLGFLLDQIVPNR